VHGSKKAKVKNSFKAEKRDASQVFFFATKATQAMNNRTEQNELNSIYSDIPDIFSDFSDSFVRSFGL